MKTVVGDGREDGLWGAGFKAGDAAGFCPWGSGNLAAKAAAYTQRPQSTTWWCVILWCRKVHNLSIT